MPIGEDGFVELAFGLPVDGSSCFICLFCDADYAFPLVLSLCSRSSPFHPAYHYIALISIVS
jgi:hypothetical protein